jgi:hypothetical protein
LGWFNVGETMKTKIDLKSAGIGLLAGVIVTFTLGAAAKTTGPVGRFQITGIQSHAFVIDTATGQVWRGYFPPAGGNTDGE